jgi:hypothetical protein
MKKNNKLLMIAIPAMIVLLAFVMYEYVYLGVRSELASIKELQDAKMKTLEQYVSLIAEKPELEKQLALLKEQAKVQEVKLVGGEPVSLASANLQGIVKGLVTARGGTITSERIGKPEDLEKKPVQAAVTPAVAVKGAVQKKTSPPPEGPKLQVLSVSMDATFPDTAALSDILYSIETRTPDLVMKELDVRVKNFKEPKDLMVRIDVTGLYEGK